MNDAITFFNQPNNKQKPYNYNNKLPGKENITLKIIPCGLINNDIFLMLKVDDTFAYLKFIPNKIKKIADNDIVTMYYINKITIKKGKPYWVNELTPNIPLVGWHGSTNPPVDMDGRPFTGIID